jgi:hypothetical protein
MRDRLVDLSHGVTDELDSPCEGVPGVLGKRPGSSGRGTGIVFWKSLDSSKISLLLEVVLPFGNSFEASAAGIDSFCWPNPGEAHGLMGVGSGSWGNFH